MARFVIRQGKEEIGRVSFPKELDAKVGVQGIGKVIFGLSNQKENAKGRCPACGYSVFLLEQSGLLGCPACYEVFKEQITAMLAPQDLVS